MRDIIIFKTNKRDKRRNLNEDVAVKVKLFYKVLLSVQFFFSEKNTQSLFINDAFFIGKLFLYSF